MKIAVLAGDGIGPEIVAEAVKALCALGLPMEFEPALVGGAATDATGDPAAALHVDGGIDALPVRRVHAFVLV